MMGGGINMEEERKRDNKVIWIEVVILLLLIVPSYNYFVYFSDNYGSCVNNPE
jgi:hypothetical protein